MDLLIIGIPASVVIVAVVEAIKRLSGIEGRLAIVIALIVGVALTTGAHLAEVWPGFDEWWQVVISGLLLGLSACGLFDFGQATISWLLRKSR